MDFHNIEVHIEEQIATITINRPPVRNALNYETLHEITEALDTIEENDQIRVMIFTGAGEKAFAAGADINQLARKKPVEEFIPGGISDVYRRIEKSNKVSIAAINGYALGGGLELALACDIRIASENVKLGLPELNLGVIPAAGGTQRLAKIVGRGVAMDVILTGEFLLAEEAKQYGLVSKVVRQDELLEAARKKAEAIIQKGPLAVQLAKLAVSKSSDIDIDSGLLIERLTQAVLHGTEDKAEGTKAFLEKRSPKFSGK